MKFTQADVTRAVKGVKAAGGVPQRVEVDLEGKITIYLAPADETDEELDRELAEFERKHRRHDPEPAAALAKLLQATATPEKPASVKKR